MPKAKDWKLIATFESEEEVEKFLKEKFVSMYKKLNSQATQKTEYKCKSRKKFNCPYGLQVVKYPCSYSFQFIISDWKEHDHSKRNCERGLTLEQQKVVDKGLQEGLVFTDILLKLESQSVPLPGLHPLKNYIYCQRKKLNLPPIEPSLAVELRKRRDRRSIAEILAGVKAGESQSDIKTQENNKFPTHSRKSLDWQTIATFESEERTESFLKGKCVSVYKKCDTKLAKKTQYKCKSRKRFNCPYAMQVVKYFDSDEFIINEWSRHDHTKRNCERGLTLEQQKVVDERLHERVNFTHIMRSFESRNIPAPGFHSLKNYIYHQRKKLSIKPRFVHPGYINSKKKNWQLIATVTGDNALNEFLADKHVSVNQKLRNLKTGKKTLYMCKSRKRFKCKYQLTIVNPEQCPEESHVFEHGEHDHTGDFRKGLNKEQRSIADSIILAGKGAADVREVFEEKNIAIPPKITLANYVSNCRRKHGLPTCVSNSAKKKRLSIGQSSASSKTKSPIKRRPNTATSKANEGIKKCLFRLNSVGVPEKEILSTIQYLFDSLVEQRQSGKLELPTAQTARRWIKTEKDKEDARRKEAERAAQSVTLSENPVATKKYPLVIDQQNCITIPNNTPQSSKKDHFFCFSPVVRYEPQVDNNNYGNVVHIQEPFLALPTVNYESLY